jgi:hypothetical protein
MYYRSVFGWYRSYYRWRQRGKFRNYLQPEERITQAFRAGNRLLFPRRFWLVVTDRAILLRVGTVVTPGFSETVRLDRATHLGPVSHRLLSGKIKPAIGLDGAEFHLWVPVIFIPEVRAADAALDAMSGKASAG